MTPKDELKPIVGEGHPLDPNRGRVLSEDDEKRVDEKGRPIAEGLLWSTAATGLYLIVAVTKVKPRINRRAIGVAHTVLREGVHLTIGVTFGKPSFEDEYWGAALELPSDLGRDKVKRQYVVEWLRDTVLESLGGIGFVPSKIAPLALWVASASEEAIRKAGL